MAWFQLHKDSWGTAMAGPVESAMGTRQTLMVTPSISEGTVAVVSDHSQNRSPGSKMLSLLPSLGSPAAHSPLRPFTKFCSVTLSQHIPTYCKILMTRNDLLNYREDKVERKKRSEEKHP